MSNASSNVEIIAEAFTTYCNTKNYQIKKGLEPNGNGIRLEHWEDSSPG